MRKSRMGLAMLSMLLFSSALVSTFTVSPSNAADYNNVGANVGFWAHYAVMTSSSQKGPTDMNITVLEIDRSNVTIKAIAYNTTFSYTQTIEGNVTIGAGNTTFPFYVFMLAGSLTKDDPIYLGASIKINDTVNRAAGGLVRACNQFNGTVVGMPTLLYWDQVTGISVYCNQTLPTYWNAWVLICTSLGPTPDYTKV